MVEWWFFSFVCLFCEIIDFLTDIWYNKKQLKGCWTMANYYFIDEEKKNIYVLELNSSNSEDFECFYLEVMANKEYDFFDNTTKMVNNALNKDMFNNLTIEEYSKDRVKELVAELGRYNVFEVNGWGAYDYYGYDNCQLYRDCLSTVLADTQNDFISNSSIVEMVHKCL